MMATTMTSTTTPTQSDYLSIVHAFKASNKNTNENSNNLLKRPQSSSSPLMELSVVPSPIQFPILPGFEASRSKHFFRDEEEDEESIDNDLQEIGDDTKQESVSIDDDHDGAIASYSDNDLADVSSRKDVVADKEARPMQHTDPNIGESSSSVPSSSSSLLVGPKDTEPSDGCHMKNESSKIQCKVQSDDRTVLPLPPSSPTIRTRPRGKILARIKREDIDPTLSADASVGGNEVQDGSSPQSQIGQLIHRSKTKPCDVFSHRGTANILHRGSLFVNFIDPFVFATRYMTFL